MDERVIGDAPAADRNQLKQCLQDVSDDELPGLLGDLGGHDLGELLTAFARADAATGIHPASALLLNNNTRMC